MNNAGRDNLLQDDTPHQTKTPKPNGLWLGVLGVAILFALIIGGQVLGVLLAIVFPPRPPLIENATQTNYSQTHYGVDEWVYRVDTLACEVASYYNAQTTGCFIDSRCQGEQLLTTNARVADCRGEMMFSQFAMRWVAIVAVDAYNPLTSTLTLQREIFWTGQLPKTAP
jgi:hypothetical protein